MLSVKQGGIKYHFLSLWYNPDYWETLLISPMASLNIGKRYIVINNNNITWKQKHSFSRLLLKMR